MKTILKYNRLKQTLYILYQMALYLSLLSLDFMNLSKESDILKYIVILSCFVYVWTNPIIPREWSLRIAFLFTAISDGFLLFGGNDGMFYGVMTFIVVQLSYGYRIHCYEIEKDSQISNHKYMKGFIGRVLILAAITGLVVVTLHFLWSPMNLQLYIVFFYFLSLCFNVIRAIYVMIKHPEDFSMRLFAFGLIFFLLCDICVGIYNIPDFCTVGEKATGFIYSYIYPLIWSFYTPSQVMLSISHLNPTIGKNVKEVIE